MNAEVFIPLTHGKVTVIDFEDFEKVRPYNWYARKDGRNWYASRTILRDDKAAIQNLHTLLMSGTEGVDHQDGDGLNNRRKNLRFATATQNGQNRRKNKNGTSRFKGVSWVARIRKWVAQIQIEKKKQYLGYFNVEEDAARAYDKKACESFGEYARLNFPEIL